MRKKLGKDSKKTRSALGLVFHSERRVAFAAAHYLRVALELSPDPSVTEDSILTLAEVREQLDKVAQAERRELDGCNCEVAAWQNRNSQVKSLVLAGGSSTSSK